LIRFLSVSPCLRGAFLAISISLALPAVGQGKGGLTLQVDGETVTILRDGYGVPHVFASTDRGVYFGDGYAVAQDRLAQMEKYRRTARGEMAEMAGPAALAADRDARTSGYAEAEREAQFARLNPHLQELLSAYAEGVNAYLRACEKDGFPGEVRKLGISIRPWKVTDSMAIGQMMARRFGGGGGGEMRNLQVISVLKATFGDRWQKVFDDLAWQNDPAAPTTLPASESPRDPLNSHPHPHTPRPPYPPTPPDCQLALIPARPADVETGRAVAEMDSELAYARANKLPTRWGSYGIAVAPAKRATGTAALVGGPQMGFATPQIAHEIHLSGPGVNVVGMGFAGVPMVLIGHNDRLAWTTTTGVGDVEDIFAETLDPADPHRYHFKGEWRAMERRVETIRVRGQDTVEHEVFHTVHGPVVQIDADRHVAYAAAKSYWERDMGALEAIDRFNRARDMREFAASVPLIATSHNWLCATQDGDIGYWFAGRFPIRDPAIDPRLPTPGEGDHEWRGFRSSSELPQAINPKQGFLANWNNKPAVWWQSGDTPAWGSTHRIQRIFDLLRAKESQTNDDLKRILRDISDNDDRAYALKPLLLGAAEDADLSPTAREAVRILRAWDNHGTDGSIGKQIFDTYVQQLRTAIFGNRFAFIPPNLLEQALSPGVLLRALQGKKAPLPMAVDYLNGRSPGAVMLEALNKTVEVLAKERGPEVSGWGYRLGRIRFEPLPGIPAQNRGTYIQIIDLSRPRVRGESILPPGQSEDPASPHYGDQRELAGYWLFKPMIDSREGL
jgi:penicillin amidase